MFTSASTAPASSNLQSSVWFSRVMYAVGIALGAYSLVAVLMFSSPYHFSEPRSTAPTPSSSKNFACACRKFLDASEPYGLPASAFGSATGTVFSPHGVINGFPGETISTGRPMTTIAPFNLPLYCCKSSGFSAATPITGPRSAPFVAADQPAVSSASTWCDGEMIWPVAGPRVQLLPIVQGSRCAAERPASLKRSNVQ